MYAQTDESAGSATSLHIRQGGTKGKHVVYQFAISWDKVLVFSCLLCTLGIEGG